MDNQQLRLFSKIMIYKDVKNFEGLYKISEYGTVVRLPKKVNSARSSTGERTLKLKELIPQLNKDGYHYTQLVNEKGERKHFFIHQLVALAFIDNPHNLKIINHKDENKTNNHYSNLEWCTIKYNNLYNNRQDKINIKLQNVKSCKPILQYDSCGNFIKGYKSINEVCRVTGFYKSGISLCCNNKKDSYNGFIWKFKE